VAVRARQKVTRIEFHFIVIMARRFAIGEHCEYSDVSRDAKGRPCVTWRPAVVLARDYRGTAPPNLGHGALGGCCTFAYVLYPLDVDEHAAERRACGDDFKPHYLQRRIERDEDTFVRKPQDGAVELEPAKRATAPAFADVEDPKERAMNADANWEHSCACATCRARRRAGEKQPTKTVDVMSVACDVYFPTIDAVWKIACDAYGVAKTSVARDHWYRPNRLLMYSEPEELHEELHDGKCPSEIQYTKEYAILCCEHFVSMFLMMSVCEFEGAEHVAERMDWTTEEWDDTRVKAYAKEFAAITKRFADGGAGRWEETVADAINSVVEGVVNDNVDWWNKHKKAKK